MDDSAGAVEAMDPETGEMLPLVGGETIPSLLKKAAEQLASATTSGEVLEARDMARVAYDAAKSAGRMARAKKAHDEVLSAVYRAQGHALTVEARAKMLLADEYDAAQERGEVAGHGGGRNFKVAEGNVETTAADLGLRRDEIHEARQLRDADRESPGIVEESVEAILQRGEEPTKAAVTREIGNYRTVTKGENEWYTPAEYIEMVRRVLGGIDLDPASCAEANETVGATHFYTKEDDGLTKRWCGRVWLNPPYSRELMPAFADKMRGSVASGDVTAALMVTHNNTDTGWFQRLAPSCSAICFPNRRIKFYRGDDIAAPVNGQMFIYFGEDVSEFHREFSTIGFVVVPA